MSMYSTGRAAKARSCRGSTKRTAQASDRLTICHECGIAFRYKQSYEQHLRDEHDTDGSLRHYPCVDCGQTFTRRQQLQEHCIQHELDILMQSMQQYELQQQQQQTQIELENQRKLDEQRREAALTELYAPPPPPPPPPKEKEKEVVAKNEKDLTPPAKKKLNMKEGSITSAKEAIVQPVTRQKRNSTSAASVSGLKSRTRSDASSMSETRSKRPKIERKPRLSSVVVPDVDVHVTRQSRRSSVQPSPVIRSTRRKSDEQKPKLDQAIPKLVIKRSALSATGSASVAPTTLQRVRSRSPSVVVLGTGDPPTPAPAPEPVAFTFNKVCMVCHMTFDGAMHMLQHAVSVHSACILSVDKESSQLLGKNNTHPVSISCVPLKPTEKCEKCTFAVKKSGNSNRKTYHTEYFMHMLTAHLFDMLCEPEEANMFSFNMQLQVLVKGHPQLFKTSISLRKRS